MASHRLKEIKEANDGKQLKDQVDHLNVKLSPEFPDPVGPVKLDVLEHLLRSYLDVLPRVTRTLDAVVDHLEEGIAEGKPFVRPESRPDVGSGALSEMTSTLRLLEERISKLEGAMRKQ